jgi:hypothetical protein
VPGRRVEADHDATGGPGADRLWQRAATRIRAATGWSLSLLGRAGSVADDRRTWLAQAGFGPAVVKAVASPFAGERAVWAAAALPVLAGRGYPVPDVVWHGRLDERWFLVVQTRLPGEPLNALGPAMLADLLALVERQAGLGPALGGWDVSWWLSVVLFDGWEGWWDISQDVAPQATRRLRQFIEPAWGHRLAAADVVHHDLGTGSPPPTSSTTTSTSATSWSVMARSPGSSTGTTRAPDPAPLTWPACCSNGTGCAWTETRRPLPAAATRSPAGSRRSPATPACGARSPTRRSPPSP